MGSKLFGTHFNAFYKDYLGWVPDSAKAVVRSSETVTLTPIEKKGGTSLVKIENPSLDPVSAADKAVYLELREPIGFDYHVGDDPGWTGIHINQPIVPVAKFGYPFVRLLNGKQSTDPSFSSPALQTGMAFDYPSHGLRVTARNVTVASASVDIALSAATCETFPMKTFSFGTDVLPPGGSGFAVVTFSNMNYPLCGDSRVVLQSENVSALGWTTDYLFPTGAVTVPAADARSFNIGFTVPATMPPGTYDLIFKIKDKTNSKVYRFVFPVTITS
jgi:hypothetical protein